MLNYEVYSELGQTRRTALFNDLRYFNQHGVFSNTGTISLGGGQREYMRFDTFWNHANPDTLESWQVGDLISSSLSWSRALRMGGFQWRKNFQLRPDLLTFPVASIDGTALVPSSLSLYVNGVQQYAASVPSGPFVLNQVGGINGAGQATVITRDALGRSVTTTLPLYVDTRLLARGLTDYSVEVGVLRRNYGRRSFGYANDPVASASGRYGVSDDLTVEAHGEVTRGVLNGGAGGLLRLGQSGVVNGIAGRQRRAQQGRAGQHRLPVPGAALQHRCAKHARQRAYGDVATRDGSPAVRAADRLSLNLALPAGQSVNLSYITYRSPGLEASKIVTAGYTASLFKSVFLNASVYQDLRDSAQRGFYFGLSMAFDDIGSAPAASRQNNVNSRSFNASKAPISAAASAGRCRAAPGRPRLPPGPAGIPGQLRPPDGPRAKQCAQQRVGAGAFRRGGADGRPPGRRAPGRQRLCPGVDRRRGQCPGTARKPPDRRDRHQRPPAGAEPERLWRQPDRHRHRGPGRRRARAGHQYQVVPRSLSGMLAAFPVERYSAATVIVHGDAAQPLPAGLPVLHVQSGKRTVVGFDGVAFVDDLSADNEMRIGDDDNLCVVRFAYVRPAAGGLPVIGPLRCRNVKRPAPCAGRQRGRPLMRRLPSLI